MRKVLVSKVLRGYNESQQNQTSEQRAKPLSWSPTSISVQKSSYTPQVVKTLEHPPDDFQTSETQDFSSLFC